MSAFTARVGRLYTQVVPALSTRAKKFLNN
jgi:hypothetical protein